MNTPTKFEPDLEAALKETFFALAMQNQVAITGSEWQRLVDSWSAKCAAMRDEDRYQFDRSLDAEREVLALMVQRLARAAIPAIKDLKSDEPKRERLWSALAWLFQRIDGKMEPQEASDLIALVS